MLCRIWHGKVAYKATDITVMRYIIVQEVIYCSTSVEISL